MELPIYTSGETRSIESSTSNHGLPVTSDAANLMKTANSSPGLPPSIKQVSTFPSFSQSSNYYNNGSSKNVEELDSNISLDSSMQSLSAMAMEDFSALLREQDAEILERQESQPPNDATPRLTSTQPNSILLGQQQQPLGVHLRPDHVPRTHPLLPPGLQLPAQNHPRRPHRHRGREELEDKGDEAFMLPQAAVDDSFVQNTSTHTDNSQERHTTTPSSLDLHEYTKNNSRLSLSLLPSTSCAAATEIHSTDPTAVEEEEEDSCSEYSSMLMTSQSSAEHHVLIVPTLLDETLPQREPLQPCRPTLGGQVFCSESLEPSLGPDLDAPMAAAGFVATDRAIHRSSSSVDAGAGNSIDNVITSSSSMDLDRRMAEAAQFAQAIGDVKVAAELQILEEDGSDDDDDDDEDDVTENGEDKVPSKPSATNDNEIEADGLLHPSLNGISISDKEDQDVLNGVLITSNLCLEQISHNPESISHAGGVMVTNESAIKSNSSASVGAYPKGRGGLRPSPYLQGHHRKRFATNRNRKKCFLDQLPTGEVGQCDYVYKGLHANPPEIVKRGTQRGNYAQLHRKAWLEVSDKYHRYGKNLRFYYRHWESLGCPTNMFFDWLDSKGEAAGQPLPEIKECPRTQLDSDTVLYITDPEVTANYALTFLRDENGRGRVVDIDGDPVFTGPDGWIFVLRDNRMYGAQKITSVTGHHTKERFHHSSFFGGKAVAAAGIFITNEQGCLTRLYPHSGHYRPGEAHMQRVLFFLHHQGVDLRTFDMDMQQILHIAREKDMVHQSSVVPSSETLPRQQHQGRPSAQPSSGFTASSTQSGGKVEKKKKVESLYLTPAVLVACFLAHKARLIGSGLMEQIHQIRKSNATSVREALDLLERENLDNHPHHHRQPSMNGSFS